MIRYALQCSAGHAFDAWFQNSSAFDAQAQAGHVLCPICGIDDVTKSLMAPALSSNRRKSDEARSDETEIDEANINDSKINEGQSLPAAGATSPTPPSGPERHMTTIDARQRLLHERLRALRHLVETHAEPVGDRFAQEVRAIEAGEADERPIYGQATAKEARELEEEGIACMPIPWVEIENDS
ncbi:MAG: DUF1178 family protein [Neomegalonema sp.]|nr:DUF1178 family protein [Neomegalonema sp.]